MPSVSRKQQKMMCADYGRAKRGRKTRTGMSAGQLRDFCKSRTKSKKKRKKS